MAPVSRVSSAMQQFGARPDTDIARLRPPHLPKGKQFATVLDALHDNRKRVFDLSKNGSPAALTLIEQIALKPGEKPEDCAACRVATREHRQPAQSA